MGMVPKYTNRNLRRTRELKTKGVMKSGQDLGAKVAIAWGSPRCLCARRLGGRVQGNRRSGGFLIAVQWQRLGRAGESAATQAPIFARSPSPRAGQLAHRVD